MAVKNLMEEIVGSVVMEILSREKDEQSQSELFREDVIAYVLNRVPPKYFTSERGIIHGKIESKFIIQKKADILFLVYEAISVVKIRRASVDHSDYSSIEEKSDFFPHILIVTGGKVFDILFGNLHDGVGRIYTTFNQPGHCPNKVFVLEYYQMCRKYKRRSIG